MNLFCRSCVTDLSQNAMISHDLDCYSAYKQCSHIRHNLVDNELDTEKCTQNPDVTVNSVCKVSVISILTLCVNVVFTKKFPKMKILCSNYEYIYARETFLVTFLSLKVNSM